MTEQTLNIRKEQDSLGIVDVPDNFYFGAQTQRAINNFQIGNELMPLEIIHSIALIKKAVAITNQSSGILTSEKTQLIIRVADEILTNKLNEHFPLTIWQSGSGTQTNMNVNEVIANRANEIAHGQKGTNQPLHPNDDVNKSQSTNDVFPTAINIATYKLILENLLPTTYALRDAIQNKSYEFAKIIKVGRTHLQDAVPLTLGQEFSGYVAQLDLCIDSLKFALQQLQQLTIGGTAVGNEVNTPPNYTHNVINNLNELTGYNFVAIKNKFAGLAGHEALVTTSGALRNFATTLYKIANDIRWLASGPRCGLGELILPDNEPGSSIMPGKVNPTQCEMLTMVCAQVIGNDATIAFSASQGQLELNVFKPISAYNLCQSIKLLTSAMHSFTEKAIYGLMANTNKIKEHLDNSLMLATALVPKLGYAQSAKIAQKALQENLTLQETVVKYSFLTTDEFEEIINTVLQKYC